MESWRSGWIKQREKNQPRRSRFKPNPSAVTAYGTGTRSIKEKTAI
jgi:hypothetical protein